VGEPDALRSAGRPRGVDETREVVGSDRLDPRSIPVGVEPPLAPFVHVAERVDVDVGIGVTVGIGVSAHTERARLGDRVHRHHGRGAGRVVDRGVSLVVGHDVVAERLECVDFGCAPHDDECRVGVCEERAQPVGRAAGVRRRDDAARGERREVDVCPLHASLGHDGDPVSRGEPKRPKPGREPTDDVA